MDNHIKLMLVYAAKLAPRASLHAHIESRGIKLVLVKCMQGQACGTCIQSAVQFDNSTDTINQENIEDFINKEALKSCCGKSVLDF